MDEADVATQEIFGKENSVSIFRRCLVEDVCMPSAPASTW
ncbi:hypothetical protein D918_10034 [Trichuris suis]|nr:hypothetical protein D918_10034 [Trichuris suis]